MNEKSTQDLENVLGSTHISKFEAYCKENKNSMNDEYAFSVYVKELIIQKGFTQQKVFFNFDKLLSVEKHTRQRDIILRICYAAHFSLEETQRALRKYEMPELYAKIPRDALIMLVFNKRPGNILEVNELLKTKGFAPLRTSGLQK